jgi:hypothetical protein
MRIFLFYITLLLSVSAAAHWDLNDVSYLMPLPQNPKASGLLIDKTAGPKGDLLPRTLLQKVPHLTNQSQADHSNQNLQVLGVRIDPCFPLPTPQQCQKQIRMVWQPLDVHPTTGVVAVDAALHSFYVLSDEDFASLLKDLMDWKKKFNVQTSGMSLRIHPAWKTSLDHSLKEFNQIILRYAGADNISRITVMTLHGGGIMWQFSGIDIDAQGDASDMQIPRLKGATSQSFVNNAPPFLKFFGGFAPRYQGADTIYYIARDSDALVDEPSIITEEIGAAYRVENPDHHSPGTVDCMTCHIAQPAKAWALKNHSILELDKHWQTATYKNIRYNLKNESADWRTNNLRAFGYFEKDIHLSQRVINESASVADALNLLIPVH